MRGASQGLSPREPAGPFAVPLRPPAPLAACCTGSLHPHPLPEPASRKLPVHSPAFFGRESRRFADSPKGGVYVAELYKYWRCTVLHTSRRQKEHTAGEMSPPFLPLRRASPGPTGGRGWQLGEERMLASGRSQAVRWSGGSPITRRPNCEGWCADWD